MGIILSAYPVFGHGLELEVRICGAVVCNLRAHSPHRIAVEPKMEISKTHINRLSKGVNGPEPRNGVYTFIIHKHNTHTHTQ